MLADAQLGRVQTVEMPSPKDSRSVNKCRLDASGLDVYISKRPPVSKLFHIIGFTFTEQGKEESTKITITSREKEARVTLISLSPLEVSAQTGFSDAGLLLSFVLLVCNGNIELMTE